MNDNADLKFNQNGSLPDDGFGRYHFGSVLHFPAVLRAAYRGDFIRRTADFVRFGDDPWFFCVLAVPKLRKATMIFCPLNLY